MRDPGFGIYFHWPFCLSKCPYCDFNSTVAEAVDSLRWRTALLRELDFFAAKKPEGLVTSLFFGGGTPSLMAPATVAALIERVTTLWPCAATLEITLEANPSTVEMSRFLDFRAAGVNRLSLGIQSLDEAALRFLGRGHDVAQALSALELAQRIFPRFSFDLIYTRPGQTVEAWSRELRQALALGADHLSLYQLTIEEGTAFAPQFARGAWCLPDEDTDVRLFELTREMTVAAGLPAYEVSNYARPGEECRHNLTYWLGGDYIGVGPGAHGRVAGTAFRQHRASTIWLERVERDGHATQAADLLSRERRSQEVLLMGARLTSGLDAETFQAVTGASLWEALDGEAMNRMIEGGFVIKTTTGLAVTEKGVLVLNAVIGELVRPS